MLFYVLGKVKELLIFKRVPVMLRQHCAGDWGLWFGCGWL